MTKKNCEHEWHEMTNEEVKAEGGIHWGNCWHVYRCSKCGITEAQDSSD